jgi:hypothetical protein
MSLTLRKPGAPDPTTDHDRPTTVTMYEAHGRGHGRPDHRPDNDFAAGRCEHAEPDGEGQARRSGVWVWWFRGLMPRPR